MPADMTGKLMQASEMLEAGKPEQARQLLVRVVQAVPNDPRAMDLMRLALTRLGLKEQALFYAERGARLAPEHPGVQTDYAILLSQTGKVKEAEALLRKVIAMDPGTANAHHALVAILLVSGRYGEAEAACRAALEVMAGDEMMEMKIGAIEMETLRAQECYERVTRVRRGMQRGLIQNPRLAEFQATIANYAGLYPEDSGEALTPLRNFALHREVGQLLAGSHPKRAKSEPAAQWVTGKRVRVAVISADFRGHPVGSFFQPILDHADRGRIELVGVMTGHADVVTARLKPKFDQWIDASAMNGKELEDALHALKPDVAMELDGLTALHVLPVLSTRPARVQVDYMGYPNTTGCPFMDYRMVDSFTDPAGAEKYAVEKLVRLDPCFLCYTPSPEAPAVTARPPTGPDGEGVVLCCFNRMQKIGRQSVKMWAEILKRLPRAKLVLKDSCFVDEGARAVVRREMERWGLDAGRVELRGIVRSLGEHLGTFNTVHIALDAYPYHGTMSTCEALWMGTPVVTLAGPTHVARVGVSLLTNAGAPELIARTPEEYVEIAVALAKDPERMKAYHAGLRGKMAGSPLCYGMGFAERWVGAVCGMARG